MKLHNKMLTLAITIISIGLFAIVAFIILVSKGNIDIDSINGAMASMGLFLFLGFFLLMVGLTWRRESIEELTQLTGENKDGK